MFAVALRLRPNFLKRSFIQSTFGYRNGSSPEMVFWISLSEYFLTSPRVCRASFESIIYVGASTNSGRVVNCVIPSVYLMSNLGLPTFPPLVLMMMTPFAPRTPYTAVAEASLSTVKLSMSSGSMLEMLRGTPSTMVRGALMLAVRVLIPLIYMVASSNPGSPLLCMATTPATRPAIDWVRFATGALSSSAVMFCCEPIREIFFCVP